MRALTPCLVLFLVVAACSSTPDTSRVVTNPVDLNYAFHPEVTKASLAWDIPQHILASMTEEQKEIALNELKRRNEGSADAREAVLITTDDGFNILYRQFSHFSYTFDLQKNGSFPSNAKILCSL